MSKPSLTILTPTWNRKELISRLYHSLTIQAAPPGAFEWLIIDDGSTDGTFEYIRSLVNLSLFPIRIIRQDNAGKCAALNHGFVEARGEWTLVIDSDDIIIKDGVNSALNILKKHRLENIAVIFCRMNFRNSDQKYFPKNLMMKKFHDFGNIGIFDTSQIYNTAIARKYPYPIQKDEKFMAEGWLFFMFDTHHDSIFSNIALVEAEYQPDGLTNKARALRAKCPLNAMLVYDIQIKSRLNAKEKARAHVNYWRYRLHAFRLKKIPTQKTKSKIFFFPLGAALFFLDLLHIRKLN